MELHSGPDLYSDLGATESKIIFRYCHYFRELGLMISGKVKLLLDWYLYDADDNIGSFKSSLQRFDVCNM